MCSLRSLRSLALNNSRVSGYSRGEAKGKPETSELYRITRTYLTCTMREKVWDKSKKVWDMSLFIPTLSDQLNQLAVT